MIFTPPYCAGPCNKAQDYNLPLCWQGEYSAEDVPVDLTSVDIPEELASGSYHMRATLNDGTTGLLLGCFDVYVKLE